MGNEGFPGQPDTDTDTERMRLGTTDPWGGVAEWLAAARADDAAAARAREHWLRRQTAEDTTFVGLLVELGKAATTVVIATRTGRLPRGRIVAVGADLVVVRDTVGDIVVPAAAIVAVRPAPGETAPSAAPEASTLTMSLSETLVELAAHRPRVVAVAGGDEVRGELCAAGRDLMSVAPDGRPRDLVHLPTAALDHLRVIGG